MERIDIKDIEKGKYQGYIWYSDAMSPTIYLGDEEIQVEEKDESFITEGLLWNPFTKTSIRINYHDGIQNVYRKKVSVQELDGCEYVTQEEYITHRMQGIPKLSFLRYWNKEKDEFCENFEVYKPGALVFIGFDNITT